MDTEQFPKYETVLESIEKLRKVVFPKFSLGDDVETFIGGISKLLLDEFGFILNTKIPYLTNDFLKALFRVREFDSFTNINLIREHSYPPIGCTKMGRCNFPQHPVFYCSDNPMIALLEVVRDFQESEKRYCISKWELIPTNENMLFESFLQTELPKENYFASIRDIVREKINDAFERTLNKKLDFQQEQGLIEYLTFLDSIFINDDDYSLSATLAHRSLYVNTNFRSDILMYPSAQTMHKGVNLAIQPNFVENNLRLSRLYILNFESFNPNSGEARIAFTQYGIVDKNIIMWKNANPNDLVYINLIKEDFGDNLEKK